MLTEWLLLLVGVVLTLGTAVFVAAEFSFVALDRSPVEKAAAGDARTGRVLAALRQLSTQLSVAQVGITLTTLRVGYLIEPSLSALLDSPLSVHRYPGRRGRTRRDRDRPSSPPRSRWSSANSSRRTSPSRNRCATARLVAAPSGSSLPLSSRW